MYTGPLCNFCEAAKRLFTRNNIKYQEIDISSRYNVSIHSLRESWTQGLGKRFHNPKTTNGVSWLYRDGEEAGTTWSYNYIHNDQNANLEILK